MEMDFQVILTKRFIASCKLTIGNRFTELSAQHNSSIPIGLPYTFTI